MKSETEKGFSNVSARKLQISYIPTDVYVLKTAFCQYFALRKKLLYSWLQGGSLRLLQINRLEYIEGNFKLSTLC